MSKGNTFETELLDHILNNAAIALIGDAGGLQPSAAAGDLFVSLHTADPGEGGNQTTNEVAYTGYARAGVDRDGAAWTVAAGEAENAADVDFPECTAGSADATHFAVGTASSGAGKILYKGALGATFAISAGKIPRFAAGALTIAED